MKSWPFSPRHVVLMPLAAVMLRERTPAPPPVEADRIDVAKCVHCGVTGPQLHPRATAVQRTS